MFSSIHTPYVFNKIHIHTCIHTFTHIIMDYMRIHHHTCCPLHAHFIYIQFAILYTHVYTTLIHALYVNIYLCTALANTYIYNTYAPTVFMLITHLFHTYTIYIYLNLQYAYIYTYTYPDFIHYSHAYILTYNSGLNLN